MLLVARSALYSSSGICPPPLCFTEPSRLHTFLTLLAVIYCFCLKRTFYTMDALCATARASGGAAGVFYCLLPCCSCCENTKKTSLGYSDHWGAHSAAGTWLLGSLWQYRLCQTCIEHPVLLCRCWSQDLDRGHLNYRFAILWTLLEFGDFGMSLSRRVSALFFNKGPFLLSVCC